MWVARRAGTKRKQHAVAEAGEQLLASFGAVGVLEAVVRAQIGNIALTENKPTEASKEMPEQFG
jgi:hypothetical protein